MNETLRIIQVVNVRWFNATAWYGLFLSRLLRDAGHEVRVLGLMGTESFGRAQDMGLEPVGLDLNATAPDALVRQFAAVRAEVRSFQPHVVNCHRGEGFLFWGAARRLAGSFALVRTRGDQRPPKNNFPNRFLHCRVADALIATNTVTAASFTERFGCCAEKVHLVLGGVDRNVFCFSPAGRDAVRQRYKIAPDDFVLGLLGRFDRVKGQRELIEAVAAVRERLAGRGPRIRLFLAGFATSISREEVEAWLREHGLEKDAVITGRCADVAACISAMDAGIIASQGSEAIARAALEIMACGVPLVGTAVGVMPDLLPERALVPPAQPELLAALVERTVCDATWRKGVQREEAARIADLTQERFVRRTLSVYRSALARVGKDRP